MRDDITKYLGTVQQSTSKTIASRIGVDQLEVARELNHMLSAGIVEREKKQGAGNEYHYWLSRAESAPSSECQMSTPAFEQKAESAAIDPAVVLVLERQVATLQNQVIDLNKRLEIAASERVAVEADRDELKVENTMQTQTIAKLRENNAALERRIDELTNAGAEFKPNELYVTVGRYAKPKRHKTIEKAQRRASSLVRNEKESEVLVCEPIGRVVRGSEWRPR